MLYKFFDENSSGGAIKREITSYQQLAGLLDKPVIRKPEKLEVYSSFNDNIWGADLVDMQLISTYNKGFRFLLFVTDIPSKYTYVVPLKDKKGTNAFQKI